MSAPDVKDWHRVLLLLLVVALTWCDDTRAQDEKKPSEGTWITFVSHRTGNNLLYRMRPDGSECEPCFGGVVKQAAGLPTGKELYLEPHWSWQSPDRVHFVSWARDALLPFGQSRVRPHFSLHLGRLDGTGASRIIALRCIEAAAWSPDGRRIAFSTVDDDADYGLMLIPPPPKRSRIYVIAIDGSSDDLIVEQPGLWAPEDWSPDGGHILLRSTEVISMKLVRSDLIELDMKIVARYQAHSQAGNPWQLEMVGRSQPVLAEAAPVSAHCGRYSPDGQSIAVIAIRKRSMVSEWKALDFELGIVSRRDGSYRKVVSYERGLRGPICWSPDGKQLLFSRPLEAGDRREHANGDAGAINQEWGLGLWSINIDGTSERMLTTGWSPDWH